MGGDKFQLQEVLHFSENCNSECSAAKWMDDTCRYRQQAACNKNSQVCSPRKSIWKNIDVKGANLLA